MYLLDFPGAANAKQIFEKIRVEFDHQPMFEITSGPEDFYVPAHKQDQRWEIPYADYQWQPPPNPSA